MEGTDTSRRAFLRRSAAAAGVGVGLAGCSAVPWMGPSFDDWFYVTEPSEHDWSVSYFDNEQFRSKATTLNATYYANIRGSGLSEWWTTGIDHRDTDWTGWFEPTAKIGVSMVAGSFDRSAVGKHVEWRDGKPTGSHEGFDLYEVSRSDPDATFSFDAWMADAYAVGDSVVLGVWTADGDEGESGPDPVEAARTVIDDRGPGGSGSGPPYRLADRVGFGLWTRGEYYHDDEQFYDPSRLPGAGAGAVSTSVAGENERRLTYAYSYDGADPPDRDGVEDWLDGQREDDEHAFGPDTEVEITLDGDLVELTGVVTGGGPIA